MVLGWKHFTTAGIKAIRGSVIAVGASHGELVKVVKQGHDVDNWMGHVVQNTRLRTVL